MATAKRKAKKATAKKTNVKVSKSKAKTAKKAPIKTPKLKKNDKPMTKSQQVAFIAEQTGLSKKDVSNVLDNLSGVIINHLQGPGEITISGVMKAKIKRRPATKARKGINPFTGEETIFKAKPARNVVKITPLKALKDSV